MQLARANICCHADSCLTSLPEVKQWYLPMVSFVSSRCTYCGHILSEELQAHGIQQHDSKLFNISSRYEQCWIYIWTINVKSQKQVDKKKTSVGNKISHSYSKWDMENNSNIELWIEVVYINGAAFIVSIYRQVKYRSIIHIKYQNEEEFSKVLKNNSKV